jgi:hypothetical protein
MLITAGPLVGGEAAEADPLGSTSARELDMKQNRNGNAPIRRFA